MGDYSKLKELAAALQAIDTVRTEKDCETFNAFYKYITPDHVLALLAEIDRLRTAEGDAMTYKAGMENVAQQRDQLKAELEKVKADRKACWEEFKVQGRQLDQLKHEHRLLTDHNEFLASSDSRLAPELRAVKDALGLDFTASVSGEVVPLIERLRKLPTCWTEVLEQSEANDQLLDKVLELNADADRYRFLCDKFGVTDLPCALERILPSDLYVADGKPSIDAAIDAARAKTQ